MAFIMEFAENFLRDRWEGHDELEQKFKERVVRVEENKANNKRRWTQPTLPYGFWNNIKYNRVYYYRLEQSNWRGKRDPYDLIKPNPFEGLKRPEWDFS